MSKVTGTRREAKAGADGDAHVDSAAQIQCIYLDSELSLSGMSSLNVTPQF